MQKPPQRNLQLVVLNLGVRFRVYSLGTRTEAHFELVLWYERGIFQKRKDKGRAPVYLWMLRKMPMIHKLFLVNELISVHVQLLEKISDVGA